MGNVYLKRRDLSRTLETYNKAIESFAMWATQEPEDPYGWSQLGQGHDILGVQLYDLGRRPQASARFGEAAKTYQRAVRLAPDDPQSLM